MTDDEKQKLVDARVRELVRELEGIAEHADDVLLDEIVRLKAKLAKAGGDG